MKSLLPQKPKRTPLRPKAAQYQPPSVMPLNKALSPEKEKAVEPPSLEDILRSAKQKGTPIVQTIIDDVPQHEKQKPIPSEDEPFQTNIGLLKPVFKFIAYVFGKAGKVLFWFTRIALETAIRTVLSFIIGLALSVSLIIIVGDYVIALNDSNMDMMQALSLSWERIIDFLKAMCR
jgi:hypothetical protein